MKLLITIFSSLAISAFGYVGFNLKHENNLLKQQVEEHVRLKNQLLLEVEENTRQRLEFEQQIIKLREDLLSSASQLNSLSSQLQSTQEMINPDYEKLESEIRRQVENEYVEEIRRANEPSSAQSIIKSLSNLDASDRRAVIQVEGQFGNILDNLDVSESKKQAVVDVLVQFTSDRNTERENLFASGLSRDEMRTQMTELLNPETVVSSMSAVLNDDELDQFRELQEQNTGQFRGRQGGAFGGGAQRTRNR